MAEDLLQVLRQLRLAGRLDEARGLIARLQQDRPADAALSALAWQHEGFWWQPLRGKAVSLQRRGPEDLALVRRCWADADFMTRFNRQALQLPADDEALRALLRRERASLPQESRGLHWTVHGPAGAVGFASLVDISLQHRRAEFLIGVLPGTAGPLAAAAAHLVLGFAARQARLERLSAHVYPDNPAALQAALHLGFEHEGVLRGHLRLADGRRSDLVLTGLLLDAAYFERHRRLRQRLLGEGVPPSAPESMVGPMMP